MLVHHATFCVNSVAHYFGSFTYSDQRSPRDSWLVGLITFGEGYHNFHHEFPYDYRNGAEYHSFDPTKWLIWTLSFVGGTYDLMKFDNETIEKGKVQMLEKQVRITLREPFCPILTRYHSLYRSLSAESCCIGGLSLRHCPSTPWRG